MPEQPRVICTRCGRSVFTVAISGPDGEPRPIPIVTRITVGQPQDTGPDVNVLDPNVRVPSFIRSLLQTPLHRMELCVWCVGEIFGQPLVSPDEDPMYDEDVADYHVGLNKVFGDDGQRKALGEASLLRQMHARSLLAVQVGRGAMKAEDVPPEHKPRPKSVDAPAPAKRGG